MSISTFCANGQLRGAVHASTQSRTQKPSTIRCSTMGLHTQVTALGVGLPIMAPTRRVTAGRSMRCSVVKAVAAPVEFDPEKEESLKYKRVVFDFDLWAKHRSSSRYSRHIFTMLTYVVVCVGPTTVLVLVCTRPLHTQIPRGALPVGTRARGGSVGQRGGLL